MAAANGGATFNKIGSLPVHNVQALADAGVAGDEVLRRYSRPEINDDPVIDDVSYSGEIPIIDFSKLLLDDPHNNDELSRLHLACLDWGFFQLINHGVPDELIEKMKGVIQDFFKLPLEEKLKIAQKPGDLEGYGQMFVVSEDQKLDWGDMILFRTLPPSLRSMHLWPTYPPTFRNTLNEYSSKVKAVAHDLFGLVSENLGADPKKLADLFGEQSVRINYYPPCPEADKVLGLSPHSDANGLTLLLQVNQVQGLQIKRNGAWFPIKPVPGAFVVNIGDVLEVLSNGKYKSIEHRAVINPEKERLSIATFHNVMPGDMVGPLPEIVRGDKEYYETMSIENFMKIYFTSKLDGKNIIDRVKLKS